MVRHSAEFYGVHPVDSIYFVNDEICGIVLIIVPLFVNLQ